MLTRAHHKGQYLLVSKHSMNDAYLTSKHGTLTDRFTLHLGSDGHFEVLGGVKILIGSKVMTQNANTQKMQHK